MTITKTITVTFIEIEVDPEDYLILDLDSEANEDETTFLPGSKAYTRVFGSSYSMESSVGTVTSEISDKPLTITDEPFTFTDEKEKTLAYLPVGNVTCTWTGAGSPSTTIVGRKIVFPSNETGVLLCSYTTKYDQWSVSYGQEGVAVITATRGEIKQFLPVTFLSAVPIIKIGLQFILDTETNEEKTSFEPGEFAHLLCYHENPAPYVVRSSAGNTTVVATGISSPVEDELIRFINTTTATLDYPPIPGSMSYEWVGPSPGTPTFNGQTVTMSEKTIGVLKCNYRTPADRIRLQYNVAGTVIAVVIQTINTTEYTASADVVYAEAVSVEPVAYELDVRDYCSDSNVAGVEVFLDGTSIGFTDINGIIYLGELMPGSTHTLKMVKVGYIDSDLDKLLNDSFTVPARTTS